MTTDAPQIGIAERVRRRMRAVRRTNTDAEMTIQASLRARGLRFIPHGVTPAGRPDIVFVDVRLAVFIDGDFWHGRVLVERGARALRKTFTVRSRAFWLPKIARNVERDGRQTRSLRRRGWAVLRLWEKEVLREPEVALERIVSTVAARARDLSRPGAV